MNPCTQQRARISGQATIPLRHEGTEFTLVEVSNLPGSCVVLLRRASPQDERLMGSTLSTLQTSSTADSTYSRLSLFSSRSSVFPPAPGIGVSRSSGRSGRY
jgi:hypothetical protein